MRYEWDPAKAAANLEKHGVAFDAIHAFDWPTAVGGHDPGDHGEERFRAYGLIGGRLHQCVYTWRGDACRLISLRKANSREITNYEEARNA
jgi:uncharacterized protein